jgi:hypothetical protein
MYKLSLTTAPIELLDASRKRIARASGFFYKTVGNKVYFVTNWHVVTGCDPLRPRFTAHRKARPHILRLRMHSRIPVEGISLEEKTYRDIELYAEGGDALWFEHPVHRCKVDVVAIELDAVRLHSIARFITIEDCDLIQDYSERVMEDVFVIGYPLGLTGGDGVLPLYKHGSIASEPSIPFLKLPRFLVNCGTDKGMSGSPAICVRSGVGPVNKFIGVYSGRLKENSEPNSEDTDDRAISDIGLIWTRSAVDEIILGAVKGSVPG